MLKITACRQCPLFEVRDLLAMAESHCRLIGYIRGRDFDHQVHQSCPFRNPEFTITVEYKP